MPDPIKKLALIVLCAVLVSTAITVVLRLRDGGRSSTPIVSPIEELRALQGAWDMREFAWYGHQLGPVAHLDIKANRMTLRIREPGQDVIWDFVVELDPSTTPKRMDLTSSGKGYSAVYELEGNVLKLYCVEGPDRPARLLSAEAAAAGDPTSNFSMACKCQRRPGLPPPPR